MAVLQLLQMYADCVRTSFFFVTLPGSYAPGPGIASCSSLSRSDGNEESRFGMGVDLFLRLWSFSACRLIASAAALIMEMLLGM